MNDIMFNTARPRIIVPTIPVTIPALWKASGMARNPPPTVALTMCIRASLFLVFSRIKTETENKKCKTRVKRQLLPDF